jgi:hypothetical protein
MAALVRSTVTSMSATGSVTKASLDNLEGCLGGTLFSPLPADFLEGAKVNDLAERNIANISVRFLNLLRVNS